MTEVLAIVTNQLDFHWRALLRPLLAGLTDDEYFWEPAPGCWTLHADDDGKVVYDFEFPPPDPPPFTTIAWRLFHIAAGCFAERATRYFPEHVATPWTQKVWEGPFDFPLTAAGGLEFLERSYEEWRSGLAAAGEAELWRPLGDDEYNVEEMKLGRDDPFLNLVLHIQREVIHHGAEILLLRDLYRATSAASSDRRPGG